MRPEPGYPAVDAVVFTALGKEYNAVREHLHGPFTEYDVRGALFELGGFDGRFGAWKVLCHETGPGNAATAALVERAVEAFRPRHLFFVGIAGGLKDTALGDVVAARFIYDYESGKDLEDGFQPRMTTHLSSFALVQRAQSVAREDDWRRRIRSPLTGTGPPRAHVKPLAAGSKVVADRRSATARLLARHCGDAVAVEMEGHGFLQAAYVNAGVDALVVRGISDRLSDKGEDNDRVWQPAASRHAAAFTFEVLHRLARPSAGERPGTRWREIRRTRRATGQSTVGFGPGHTAVVVAGDGSIERWDLGSGEELGGIPGGAALRLGHQAVVSPTRHSVAVARPGSLDLMHFTGRSSEHRLRSVPLARDEFLVTGGGEVLATHDRRGLALRAFDDGRVLREIPCPAGLATTSISTDGFVVAMATSDRVHIHRADAPPAEKHIRNRLPLVRLGCWLAVSPSGRHVACADEGRVLWLRRGLLSHVTEAPEITHLQQSGRYDDFAAHPDGGLLAAVGTGGLVRVWEW